MKFNYLIWSFISLTSAFDCSVEELSEYDFSSLKGIKQVSLGYDTPPSVTNQTWSFGICESINNVENCPSDSDICGVIKVSLPGQEPFVSQIVSFSSKLQKKYTPYAKDSGVGISIAFEGANWGSNKIDAIIDFQCPSDDEQESTNFEVTNWDGDILQAHIMSRAGCVSSKSSKPKKDAPGSKDDSSWGWFTWVFIFLVLFLSIYIIGGAWFQYTRNNTVDIQSALAEVLENLIELLRGAPTFLREVVEKIVGSNNRGEYSAV